MERTMRLRLALRGFMGVEAFDVETIAGTARRASQGLLASASVCDIDMIFLKGLTYRELAEVLGEKDRV
eukprot:6263155-Pyramimonas_sp.AAC.1